MPKDQWRAANERARYGPSQHKSSLKQGKRTKKKVLARLVPLRKHSGKSIAVVLKEDPEYLRWCLDNINSSSERVSEFLDDLRFLEKKGLL